MIYRPKALFVAANVWSSIRENRKAMYKVLIESFPHQNIQFIHVLISIFTEQSNVPNIQKKTGEKLGAYY